MLIQLYVFLFFFFFNDTATTEIYTLSLTRRSSDLPAWRGTWHGGRTAAPRPPWRRRHRAGCPDRKSTRLNSSHLVISYAVFCLKKKKLEKIRQYRHTTHYMRSMCHDVSAV